MLRGHQDRVSSAFFSPDGRRVVSASVDKTVRLWDADGTEELKVFSGHNDHVSGAAFSPDGRRIVSASRDKTLRLWSADGSGQSIVLNQGNEEAVRGDRPFSPDGRRIVTSSDSEGAAVRIWSTDGAGEPFVLRGGSNANIIMASFSPEGGRIVAALHEDNAVLLWNHIEPLSGPSDPSLWTATRYCMPLHVRQRLLDFPEEQSRADLERCERQVRMHAP